MLGWNRLTEADAFDGWTLEDSLQIPRLCKQFDTGVTAVILVIHSDGTLRTGFSTDTIPLVRVGADYPPGTDLTEVKAETASEAHAVAVMLGMAEARPAGQKEETDA